VQGLLIKVDADNFASAEFGSKQSRGFPSRNRSPARARQPKYFNQPLQAQLRCRMRTGAECRAGSSRTLIAVGHRRRMPGRDNP